MNGCLFFPTNITNKNFLLYEIDDAERKRTIIIIIILVFCLNIYIYIFHSSLTVTDVDKLFVVLSFVSLFLNSNDLTS